MKNAIVRINDETGVKKFPVKGLAEAGELVREFSLKAIGEFTAVVFDDDGYVVSINPNGTLYAFFK
jgi:hypothetical protein